MKTVGVLGGMSWESTLDWYRSANQIVRERLGGFHSARLLIDSVDFADIEAMQTRGEWHGAGELLAQRAKALEGAGAEITVPCDLGSAIRGSGLREVNPSRKMRRNEVRHLFDD